MPPFVRVSRDRRGYEHTYLFQVRGAGGRAGRPRLVYWFRTPPGVRLGRPAFDPTMREALQARYPAQAFDWEKFEAIPPPPEVENWRERRRLEKAAKRARAAEAAEGAESADAAELDDEARADAADKSQADAGSRAAEARSADDGADDASHDVVARAGGPSAEGDAEVKGARPERRRGRRRGRGRGRDGEARGQEAAPVSVDAPPDEVAPDAGTEPDSGS